MYKNRGTLARIWLYNEVHGVNRTPGVHVKSQGWTIYESGGYLVISSQQVMNLFEKEKKVNK